MKPLSLLAAALLAILPARADTVAAKLLAGRPATQLLRTTISDTPATQRLDGHAYIAGFEVLGAPVPIPAASAARLATLAADPAAFARNDTDEKTNPSNAYRPGIAYRFGSGDSAIDLLVCFSCDKVALVPAGADRVALVRDLTQPARDVLLGIAKDLLPGDEAIQELPRVRRANPVPPPPAPLPADLPGPGPSR